MFIVPKIRETDCHGSGHFGAPRGNRTHKGLDFSCPSKTSVHSHVGGIVTKLGFPYANHLEYRYVEVRDQNGFFHRFFYVEPFVERGDRIFIGDKLGETQELGCLYEGITEHFHYEVIKYDRGDKIYYDPNNFKVGKNEFR